MRLDTRATFYLVHQDITNPISVTILSYIKREDGTVIACISGWHRGVPLTVGRFHGRLTDLLLAERGMVQQHSRVFRATFTSLQPSPNVYHPTVGQLSDSWVVNMSEMVPSTTIGSTLDGDTHEHDDDGVMEFDWAHAHHLAPSIPAFFVAEKFARTRLVSAARSDQAGPGGEQPSAMPPH